MCCWWNRIKQHRSGTAETRRCFYLIRRKASEWRGRDSHERRRSRSKHTLTPQQMYTGSTKGTKKDFTDVLSNARMKECDMLECVQGLWDFWTLSADRSQARKRTTHWDLRRQVHAVFCLRTHWSAHGSFTAAFKLPLDLREDMLPKIHLHLCI